MPVKNPPSDLRRSLVKYAANILGRRPYFSSVLKRKLIARAQKLGFDEFDDEVDSVIQDLAKSGYLDDLYLAEAYIRKELNKGWGPKIISLKMKRLGITGELISQALQTQADLHAQTVSIRHHLKKLAKYDRPHQINKFFQRGFNAPAIFKAFDGRHSEE